MIDALEMKHLCRSQEHTCSGWPGNNKHYQLALLAADGKYNLETGGNKGDKGDFWHDGMEIGPGPVDTVASVTVLTNNGDYPNTNSYISGRIVQTGIRIFNFSKSREVMSFSVVGLSDDPVQPSSSPSIQSFVPSSSAPSNVTFVPSQVERYSVRLKPRNH